MKYQANQINYQSQHSQEWMDRAPVQVLSYLREELVLILRKSYRQPCKYEYHVASQPQVHVVVRNQGNYGLHFLQRQGTRDHARRELVGVSLM